MTEIVTGTAKSKAECRRKLLEESVAESKEIRCQFGSPKDFSPYRKLDVSILKKQSGEKPVYLVENKELKIIGKAFVPDRDFPSGIVDDDAVLYGSRFIDYSKIGKAAALSRLNASV